MNRLVRIAVSRCQLSPAALIQLIALTLFFIAWPRSLSAQTLEHRYSFDSADGSTNAIDSVGGTNWNGYLVGNAYITNNAVVLPFTAGSTSANPAGYVQLPNGIVTNDASITVECWLTDFRGQTWAEAWCFGDSGAGAGHPPTSGTAYVGMIPTSAANGSGPIDYRVAFNLTGSDEEDVVDKAAKTIPTNVEVYSVVTYDYTAVTGRLYLNGVQVGLGSIPHNLSPSNYMATFNNWIGRDQFSGDPTFAGSVDELRIWNGAVSPLYIALSEAAGPDIVLTNLTPESISVSVTNTNLIGTQTEQATVTINLSQVSNLVATVAATNWISGNTNVLTVNTNGLITAINGGTTTVSATIDGVVGKSGLITVAVTKPEIVQEPASLSLYVGETAVLTVDAVGGDLSYQWSVGGAPINGATTSSLTLADILLTNAGNYTVSVSNSLGSSNSLAASLTVTEPTLVHRWSFDEAATNEIDLDSVGDANATNMNGVYLDGVGNVVIPNPLGSGFTSGNNSSPYIAFPNGILSNLNSLTIEIWVAETNAYTWAEVFCFGDSTAGPGNAGSGTNYISFIPSSGPGDMRAAFKLQNEDDVIWPNTTMPTNAEEYVVITYDQLSTVATLSLNGVMVGSTNITIQPEPGVNFTPASMGDTFNDFGGRDEWTGDPIFNGSINELRIWNAPVSPLYQALTFIAGPDVLITNTTPSSVTVSVTNTMIAGQSQQATVTGNFAQVDNAPLIAGLATWTSGNTNVLTVDGNGLITAVASGKTTISATVGGITGISAPITVSVLPPQITGQPVSLNLYAGQTAVFSVAVLGGEVTYQWSQGNSTIGGATNSILTLADVTLTQAGTYNVSISNPSGKTNASATLTVAEPTLVHRWSFNDPAGSLTDLDSIGGADGTNMGNAYIDTTNGTITLPDTNTTSTTPGASYVQFPSGLLTNLESATIEVWATDNGARTWAEIWSFGGSTNGYNNIDNQTNYIGLIPTTSSGDMRAAFKVLSEEDVIWPNTPLPTNVEEHVTVTYDNTTTTGAIYVNGFQVAVNTNITITPAQLGNTYNNYLGRDQFEDPIFHGSVDELRIYAGPLTPTDIENNDASGPNTLVKPGTANLSAVSIAPSGTNVVISWQQGTLLQATNLLGPWLTNAAAVSPFTAAATNRSEFYKVLLNP